MLHDTQNQHKIIKDLNIRPETVKTTRKKYRGKHDIGLVNDFVGMIPKHRQQKQK